MAIVIVKRSEEYIMHHGIKGQEWGKRNGPPYPLDASDHSKKEKTRAIGSSSKKETREEKREKTFKQMTEGTKDTGSKSTLGNEIVSTVMFPPYAIVFGVKGVEAAAGAAKAKKFEKERSDCEIDKKTGLKLKKDKEMSKEDDIERVNPSVNNFNENTKNNCMLCTTTYDLRRRGYDVTAGTSINGYDPRAVTKWYPNAKLNTIKDTSAFDPKGNGAKIPSITKELTSQGNGARGNIMVNWKRGSGHSMVYEIENGSLRVIDCQVNKVYDSPQKIEKLFKSTWGGVTYARLDNVDFDPKRIKEIVR